MVKVNGFVATVYVQKNSDNLRDTHVNNIAREAGGIRY